jgi:hypothetical protein
MQERALVKQQSWPIGMFNTYSLTIKEPLDFFRLHLEFLSKAWGQSVVLQEKGLL